jgi:hypothetical protein
MKKTFVVDFVTSVSILLFLFLESTLFHKHTIPGLCLDILLFVYFTYRAFKRTLTIPAYLFPAISLFGIIKFTAQTYFPSAFTDLHIIMILVVIVLIAGKNLVFLKPQRKIVRTHGNPPKMTDIPPDSIFVTKDIILPGPQRLLHTQVIGSTGSGKTRYVFYPWALQDIKNNVGVFIYDIKSNMRKKIERFVATADRDKDYFFFNLGDKKSMKYNPLAGDNASEIANRVFKALYFDMEGSEKHYIDIAERFLFSAIAVLKKKWPVITFKDLYYITADPKQYLQPICNEFPEDISAQYLLDFINKKDLAKNLLGLLNKLAKFATEPWTDQINTLTPDIDIAKIISENKILLFQANSGIYKQEYKPLSILVMMHLQSEIAKRYINPPEKPFMIYLDEFYNVLYRDFPEMINKAREAKVGLIFGHQSIGDLEMFGPHIKNIILTNSRNKIVFNIEDPLTAEYFSKAFGTQTIEKRINSFSTKSGISQSGYTIKEEEEFIVHPNELKDLKLGEGYTKIETPDGRSIEKGKFSDIKKRLSWRKLNLSYTPGSTGKTTNFTVSYTPPAKKRSLKNKFSLKNIIKRAPKNLDDVMAESMEPQEE